MLMKRFTERRSKEEETNVEKLTREFGGSSFTETSALLAACCTTGIPVPIAIRNPENDGRWEATVMKGQEEF
jgi:hypothetical protein